MPDFHEAWYVLIMAFLEGTTIPNRFAYEQSFNRSPTDSLVMQSLAGRLRYWCHSYYSYNNSSGSIQKRRLLIEFAVRVLLNVDKCMNNEMRTAAFNFLDSLRVRDMSWNIIASWSNSFCIHSGLERYYKSECLSNTGIDRLMRHIKDKNFSALEVLFTYPCLDLEVWFYKPVHSNLEYSLCPCCDGLNPLDLMGGKQTDVCKEAEKRYIQKQKVEAPIRTMQSIVKSSRERNDRIVDTWTFDKTAFNTLTREDFDDHRGTGLSFDQCVYEIAKFCKLIDNINALIKTMEEIMNSTISLLDTDPSAYDSLQVTSWSQDVFDCRTEVDCMLRTTYVRTINNTVRDVKRCVDLKHSNELHRPWAVHTPEGVQHQNQLTRFTVRMLALQNENGKTSHDTLIELFREGCIMRGGEKFVLDKEEIVEAFTFIAMKFEHGFKRFGDDLEVTDKYSLSSKYHIGESNFLEVYKKQRLLNKERHLVQQRKEETRQKCEDDTLGSLAYLFCSSD